jgi:ATP-dependent DNA helicase DinG
MNRNEMKVEGYHRSVSRNMFLTIIIVSITPMILVSAIILYQFHSSYTEKVHAHLGTLVKKHKQNIDGFLNEKLADIRFLADTFTFEELSNKAFLEDRLHSIIEAGTGTGKTIGYLVPFIMSEKKCVISTGTKNLQEQIFLKDIPLILRAIGIKADSLLMKGRKNYICIRKYDQYFSTPHLFEPSLKKTGDRLKEWLKGTEFGDRAELPWLTDDDPLWDIISSSSEQCKGSECMYREDCFLNNLRRRAAKAQIIIVNHHLFFADLMVKGGGFGEIIPRFQAVIFDEAHQIEDIATTYFGVSLSTGQLKDFVKDIEDETKALNGKDRKVTKKDLNTIRGFTEQIQAFFTSSDDRGRLEEEDLLRIHEGAARGIRMALNNIQIRCGQALGQRAEDLSQALETIFASNDPNWLEWYEKRKKSVVFHASPLDISDSMRELLYAKVKTTIFTSATLSTNGSFDYIRSRLGVPENALEGIYPSHFDFKRQALMYIPRDLPIPSSRDFAPVVAQRIIEILKITEGRALLLFTSHLNMNMVHRTIKGMTAYKIYKQGDAPRSMLLDKFREDTNSVLLATGSFWQGVDVPGEALSCLLIDKLPFDSPGDPIVGARIESIQEQNGNPFMEYQLPSAIISLKQGLGRLIRQSSDRGILTILDRRILNSRYGRFFLDSLPEIPVSHSLEDISRFFEQLYETETGGNNLGN